MKKYRKYRMENSMFFFAKVMRRLPVSASIKQRYNKMRHRRINKLLLPYFIAAQEKVDFSYTKTKNDGPIWVFWWQGKKNMPELVKNCILSIQKHANKRKVVIIDRNNIDNYFKISSRVLKLQKKNKISMAAFSDIIRFNLLRKYGGLWIDATVFVRKMIPSKYFSDFFTCSGYGSDNLFFVTEGLWCSFLIGGCKNNPIFQFMSAFYEEYWNKNDQIMDYFILDYALSYAWKHNWGNFKTYTLMNKNKNNPYIFSLMPLLNEKYDKRILKKISANTEMYKLSYKKRLKSNQDTFYNEIINTEDVNG